MRRFDFGIHWIGKPLRHLDFDDENPSLQIRLLKQINELRGTTSHASFYEYRRSSRTLTPSPGKKASSNNQGR